MGAKVCGPSHEDLGLPCQDAFAFSVDGSRLVVAVADGAGSARFSDFGSQSLVDGVVKRLRASPKCSIDSDMVESYWRGELKAAIGEIRETVLAAYVGRTAPGMDTPRVPDAEPAPGSDLSLSRSGWGDADSSLPAPPHSEIQRPVPLGTVSPDFQDFSSTLVGWVTEPTGGFFFHIGDGIAVARHALDVPTDCTVSKPQNGEYANETYFYTRDDWADYLRLLPFGPAVELIACSDGISGFVLDRTGNGIAPGFVDPVGRFLASRESEAGTSALGELLNRDAVRKQNKDDKALVWCRPIELAPANGSS